MTIQDLREAFEKKLGQKLRDGPATPEAALALRVDRWVDLLLESFRELGKTRGLEVAPIRRGVGELGWEQVWGRNLSPDHARLSRTPPGELFQLELALELVENTLRPGMRPESAVEETVFDLARLVWARSPAKVLIFGARRDPDPLNTLDVVEAGLTSVIEARDRESDYLLVCFPNLEKASFVTPDRAVLWTRIVAHGKPDKARQVSFPDLLRP